MARAAERILVGETLYPPPSVKFVGDNYPPVYFFLYAGMMKLLGPSLIAGRAISLAATACIALAIWNISRGRGGNRVDGEAPAGESGCDPSTRGQRAGRLALVALFLAFYAVGGQVFDLARVDMAAIAFAAWAVLLLACATCIRSAALAGLLMAAAILTKHNMVMIGALAGAGLLFLQPKRAIVYGLLAAGLPAAAFTWLHASSDGWSSYYLFTQPAMHPFGGGSRWIRFFSQDVSHHGLLLAAGLGAGALFLFRTGKMSVAAGDWWGPGSRARELAADASAPMNRRLLEFLGRRGRRPLLSPSSAGDGSRRRISAGDGADARLILLLLAAAGGIGVTLMGRLKAGGFSNNLVPAWTFAVLAAAGTWPMVRVRAIRCGYSLRRVEGAFWLVIIGVSLSLAGSYAEIDWRRWLAMGERQAAAAELDKQIAGLSAEGPAWMPYHSFDVSRGGFAHLCPAGFLMDDDSYPAKTLFEQDVARHLERRTWAAIVLDGDEGRFVSERCTALLAAGYAQSRLGRHIADGCTALTGKRTGPQRVYIRQPLNHGPG